MGRVEICASTDGLNSGSDRGPGVGGGGRLAGAAGAATASTTSIKMAVPTVRDTLRSFWADADATVGLNIQELVNAVLCGQPAHEDPRAGVDAGLTRDVRI